MSATTNHVVITENLLPDGRFTAFIRRTGSESHLIETRPTVNFEIATNEASRLAKIFGLQVIAIQAAVRTLHR